MSVIGGRSGWRRAFAGGGGVVAFTAFVLSGCGGRTSFLDGSAYDPSGFGGSGGQQGGSAGSAGSLSGGAGGFNPSLATAPCRAYCPGYGTQCAASLKGNDCLAACEQEINDGGGRCQALGIQTLQCLTPFFTPGGTGCQAAVDRALARCGRLADDFRKCKGAAAPPTMTPTSPGKTDLTSCQQLQADESPSSCTDLYLCGAQVFLVQCEQASPNGPRQCDCSGRTGSLPSGTSCKEAARALCP